MEEVKKKKTYRNFTRSEKAIVHAYVELMQKLNNRVPTNCPERAKHYFFIFTT